MRRKRRDLAVTTRIVELEIDVQCARHCAPAGRVGLVVDQTAAMLRQFGATRATPWSALFAHVPTLFERHPGLELVLLPSPVARDACSRAAAAAPQVFEDAGAARVALARGPAGDVRPVAVGLAGFEPAPTARRPLSVVVVLGDADRCPAPRRFDPSRFRFDVVRADRALDATNFLKKLDDAVERASRRCE